MAPNVIASEMMNSHMVNFRDGIAYGGGSSRAVPYPFTAWSYSLTISFLPSRSESGRDHDKQVKPKDAHKMPINGRAFEQTPARRALSWKCFCDEIRKSSNATE